MYPATGALPPLFLPVYAGSVKANLSLGCHHAGRASQPDRGTSAITLIHRNRTPALEAHVFANLRGGNQGTCVKDNGNLAAQLPRLGFECVKVIELDFTVNADRKLSLAHNGNQRAPAMRSSLFAHFALSSRPPLHRRRR
jgi:hypothetical protein